MKKELWQYEKEGVDRMYDNLHFALFDEMGLGKSVQSIALLEKLFNEGKLKNCLIICPSSLKKQWYNLIREFSDLDCQIIEGSKKQRIELWNAFSTIKIANYELFRFDDLPFTTNWDVVVLDEATRIKNFYNKTTQRIRLLKADRKYLLTGTPIENTGKELWSLFNWLDYRVLGKYMAFEDRYLEVGYQRIGNRLIKMIYGMKNIEELKQRLQPYYLRRTKEDIGLQLPPLIKENIYVELSQEEKGVLRELKKMAKEKIDREESFIGIVQMMRVVCNGLSGLANTHSQDIKIHQLSQSLTTTNNTKVDEVVKLVEELEKENVGKIVVFSEFLTPLEELRSRFFNSLLLTGEEKVKEKEMNIQNFTSGECQILLAQTKVGGYGLNLQNANVVIFINRPWNPAVEEQAIARLYRTGQKKTVFVYYLLAEDSIEDRVNEVLENKQEIREEFLRKVIVE